MNIVRTSLLALSLSLLSVAAHADVYGYIDANGEAHFATEKLDKRYQLFARGDQALNASRLTPLTNVENAAEKETPLFRYLSQHPNLKKYEKLLNDAANEFNLDPTLLKAVMAAESGFNPNAVSPKGAVGLMQLMPATAERFGLQADRKKSIAQKLTDPKTNIRLGARYLRVLRDLYPNQQHLVLASYNAGEGAVQKYNNAIPPFPETRNYVKLVTQFYNLYQPTSRFADNAVFSNRRSDSKRIHMIIPGRRDSNPSADTSSAYPITSIE
ncbi:lytic transglycosylase domain-containing protein [Herminiimonas fonticola]|uniref:Soluble lytic murein transglycosylase-like protein n=1 Tax=Herminiimonas fonticola TaxID=303380 RepID=A0A4R6G5G6_9BURK|nr:lytic transglycosylase domain-containing protein [Herminiimonas fonticola]RBA23685.1 Soluble lytic murein transglycosylase [Herminiimonas fonticola]TDN89687.1 soluble lytic murein transglycosylase-like protein [Herminiimonas fonticola]